MSISTESLASYVGPDTCFVETGTEYGGSTASALSFGAVIWTCEIDPIKVRVAHEKMDGLPDAAENLNIVCMDSPSFLREAMPRALKTGRRIVCWLDAHSPLKCPILLELAEIKASGVKPDVILIDDLRYFRSGHWGISYSQVRAAVEAIGPYALSEIHGSPLDVYPRDSRRNDILLAEKK